jgi:GNAT superfamily N-acetyltransferase
MSYAIVIATSKRDIADVRALFAEYHAWLGGAVCAQHLAEEIAALPGPYAPPDGRLLVARDESGTAVGVVAVRSHEAGGAEMKRLYVRPAARGGGLGRDLADAAVAAARELGYGRVLLTTLPDAMRGALLMYEAMGFRPTAPFTDHSHVSQGFPIAYLELTLSTSEGAYESASESV